MEPSPPPILEYRSPQAKRKWFGRYQGEFILFCVVAFDCMMMFAPNAQRLLPIVVLLSFGLFVVLFAAVLWMVMNVVAVLPRRHREQLPTVLRKATLLSCFYLVLAGLILASIALTQRI